MKHIVVYFIALLLATAAVAADPVTTPSPASVKESALQPAKLRLYMIPSVAPLSNDNQPIEGLSGICDVSTDLSYMDCRFISFTVHRPWFEPSPAESADLLKEVRKAFKDVSDEETAKAIKNICDDSEHQASLAEAIRISKLKPTGGLPQIWQAFDDMCRTKSREAIVELLMAHSEDTCFVEGDYERDSVRFMHMGPGIWQHKETQGSCLEQYESTLILADEAQTLKYGSTRRWSLRRVMTSVDTERCPGQKDRLGDIMGPYTWVQQQFTAKCKVLVLGEQPTFLGLVGSSDD
jgi:hypothetical protein